MGKLTINELSKSLLGYLQPKQDDTLNTEDKTITGAINELEQEINDLFQSANNGKQLIADAIGEPLNSEQTFSAMSNNIKSLLNTFKTNMMSSGVTVEANDKFKQLIDKIATLAEDTTLRDSLASVLEDEGVEVLPEDDMASLIVKTDEEFDRKNAIKILDIMTSTSLPAVVKENQIVVVTNNSTNNIVVSKNEPAKPVQGLVWVRDTEKTIATTDYSANLTDSMMVCYNFKYCYQYDGSSFIEVPGYIGISGVWQPLKKGFTILSKNGYDNSGIVTFNRQYYTGDDFAGSLQEGKGLYFYWGTSGADRTVQYITSNKVNFSEFSKLVLRYNLTTTTNWTAVTYICLGYGLQQPSTFLNALGYWDGGQIQYTKWESNDDRYAWNTYTEYEGSMEFDISNLSSEYYIGFTIFVDTPTTLYIESIELL